MKLMKNKKVLLYYLLELLLTISIFITIIILVFKFTILDKKYLINVLDKNNYYHELYIDINNDFDNYITSSGFDNTITKNLFTEKDLKKIIHKNAENYYNGKNIKIDTTLLKEKLDNNINDYLKKININITDEDALNRFKEEIVNIYINKIIIHKEIIKTSSIFYKINSILNILLVSLIILNIILFIIIKIIFKKVTLSIPIITSCCILLIIYIYLNSHVNVNSILIWNSYLSNIIKCIIKDLFNIIKYIFIIGFILEFTKLIIILCIYKNKKEI